LADKKTNFTSLLLATHPPISACGILNCHMAWACLIHLFHYLLSAENLENGPGKVPNWPHIHQSEHVEFLTETWLGCVLSICFTTSLQKKLRKCPHWRPVSRI